MVDIDWGLTGKVALVTGAAGGIGAEVCRLFAAAGCRLALIDQDEDRLADIQRETSAELTISADLADPAEAQRLVLQTESALGAIDILINVAGINARGPAEQVTLEAWERVQAVNLRAPFLLAQAAAGRMLVRGTGVIINVVSELAIAAAPGMAPYIASKAGLVGLTHALAAEWGGRGIRVNAVAPGLTETPLTRATLADAEYYRKAVESVPLKRMGRPDDIAPAVLFLASDLARFVHGHVLVVDGGFTVV